MKNTIVTFTVAIFIALFACINCACAQDWMKKDTRVASLLVDTTYVRSMVVTIMPKEKGSVHTHPAHFFYALTDGTLIVHFTDGKSETYELKAGDSGYSDPERPHWTENVGDKPVKFLLVELKEHPYVQARNK